MTHHANFNRRARRAAILTVALSACFVFGVIVLVSGDWVPGGVIVVAAVVGLAREVSVIQKLCSTGSRPSPPKSKPAS